MPAAVCGSVHVLGSPRYAPFSVTRPSGFSHLIRITIRGMLSDAGAANSLGFSVTNAVVLNIR